MENTTLNVTKPAHERFGKLRLAYSARVGRQVSQPEHMDYIAELLEHLDKCARCTDVVQGCITKKGE